MKNIDKELERIRSDRTRSNILMTLESKTIVYLCRIMPRWISSDMLSIIGLMGSVLILFSLYAGTFNSHFLLLGVVGFIVQWFGDSLDGRLAHYRNIPRKWYGWSLDINMDWISTCLIGLGFYLYFPDYKIIAFIFVIAYGGSMILALIRYKISDKYIIDSHYFGPTELRILVSVFLILEIYLPGVLQLFGLFGSILVISFNIHQSFQIIHQGDLRDKNEKAGKLTLEI